ncbi:parallel beta helix pectate lyase-like protein [Rahnella sp. BIGb0236]|uniref:right-handed parallel beta-helix repeat-containing protein n=1 Tax=Rahnella sp. BIGb0236 TaxID=2485117 RepID=UPI00105F0C4B|nr:right-handed parallel beta-helix repeat-containing protein [Rahnella sp. BIGb0236]TDS86242.1 parallel beta helix pectate lyase-like protein [Rahnella sp. BIGb0236]
MAVTKRNLIKYGVSVFFYYYLTKGITSTAIASEPPENFSEKIRSNKEILKLKLKNILTEQELKNKSPSSNFDYFFVSSANSHQDKVVVFIYEGLRSVGQGLITSLDGSVWKPYDIELELTDFGAVGDGKTDSSDSIELALNSGIPIKESRPNNYLLTRTLTLRDGFLSFSGFGKGKTVFLLNHFLNGIVYSKPLFQSTKSKVLLSGYTLKRLNSSLYTGRAGPKGLYVSNADPLLIDDVEECYGLGYGIHVDFSNNVIVKNCYVHDHKGLIAGLSGTDGIHFYRSKNVTAERNFVHDVGDDALSAGSFDKGNKAQNITFNDNRIVSCKGGIKVYSYANDIFINRNVIVGSREGGVYLTDDKNSPEDSYIANVVIKNNKFSFIGVLGESNESGALRIRFWPKPNKSSRIDNVVFENNTIVNCLLGVSTLAYDSSKRLSNLFIVGNNFSVDKNHVGKIKGYYIRVIQCDEKLIIERNNFQSSKEILPVAKDYQSDNLKWSSTAEMKFKDNSINNH